MKLRNLAFVPFPLLTVHTAFADSSIRVAGVFCKTRQDQTAFLSQIAAGENEVMAANAVNKMRGSQVCADYMAVDVIPGGEKTVISGGLVFKLQSFTFLPERVEHWAGTVTGALDQVVQKDM